MPKSFFVEKDLESWGPKIHGTCNYLQSFYVAAPIDKCRNNKNDPLAMFRNNILKKKNNIIKETRTMELTCRLLIMK